MSTVEQYLSSYVRNRRRLTAARAVAIADAFGAIWLIGCLLMNQYFSISNVFLSTELVIGGLITLGIVARPIWFLFRRYDPVAVAAEIERREPAFDQRLITVVSQQNGSSLRDHLLLEIEPILSRRAARLLVPIRPMIFPVVVMICANVIYARLLHHFLHISR